VGASIQLRRRLDWADTDAAGYWHHSTFWVWAEAGEAELMRSLGLTGLTFGFTPRRSVSAEFHRPVFFDDEVTITFTVDAVGTTSATYRIEVERDGDRVAEGTMAVVLTADGRPAPWPDDARTVLLGAP
jgi:acyl-CoA thioester hydrolase